MNHLFWPTAVIAIILFWVGMQTEQRLANRSARIAFLLIASIVAIPGFLFAFYYTKLLGEPIWYYEFRATRFTELTAAGAGLLAGYVHQLRKSVPRLKRQLRTFTLPILFTLIIAVPYLKPVLRPLRKDQLSEQWQGRVCMQSTPATCGPASAATILAMLGVNISEAELAHESLTYAGGTENWYLVRALRKRGRQASYHKVDPDEPTFPTPSIAGVQLQHGTGHFTALIGREGTNYIVGDPLTGETTSSLATFRSQYTFTGFFLSIK